MDRITLGEFLSTRPNAKITVDTSGEPWVVWPSAMHKTERDELFRLVGAIDAYGTWRWLREEQLTHPSFSERRQITAATVSHFLQKPPRVDTLRQVLVNGDLSVLAEPIAWAWEEIMEVVERGVWRCQPDGTRIAFTAFLEAPCHQR